MALFVSGKGFVRTGSMCKVSNIAACLFQQNVLPTRCCVTSSILLIRKLSTSGQRCLLGEFSKELKSSNVTTGGSDCRRFLSSTQLDHTVTLPKPDKDLYQLIQTNLDGIFLDIQEELKQNTSIPELQSISTYYFDSQGKAIRPLITILMARAINCHLDKDNCELSPSQRRVAMISEMIHSASLIHDDLVDQSDVRRGKPSVNALWTPRQVAAAGDFILAVASAMIARLRDDDVTLVLSRVTHDLVRGELMQLGTKLTVNERFAHYLDKSYCKTASLIANSAKAVAILGKADAELVEIAYRYGRNVGIAFQLVDDMLDFVSTSEAMGKPTAVDLKLGLATAPVLFACEKYPELNLMILRRFEVPGDVERAFEIVHESRGLEETQILAHKYCTEAVKCARLLDDSPYQQGLQFVSNLVLNRMK